MSKLTKHQKEQLKQLYSMSHFSMADLWRFAPAGHPYFDSRLPYFKHFIRRFKKLGGMTSKVSKEIGLE